MKSAGDPEQTVGHDEMAPLMLAALAPVMLRTGVTPEQADRTIAALRLLARGGPGAWVAGGSLAASVGLARLRSDRSLIAARRRLKASRWGRGLALPAGTQPTASQARTPRCRPVGTGRPTRAQPRAPQILGGPGRGGSGGVVDQAARGEHVRFAPWVATPPSSTRALGLRARPRRTCRRRLRGCPRGGRPRRHRDAETRRAGSQVGC